MQFNLTYNNHLRFGWGDGIYNFQDINKQKFWIDIGRASYWPKNFKSECIRAAELIAASTSRPILICFSGGIDSEIVLNSFREIRADFEICIMKIRYKGEIINSHDIDIAFRTCKRFKLDYYTFDIDIEPVIVNDVAKLISIYQTTSKNVNTAVILMHHEIIKKFPNHNTVYGGGEIKLARYNPSEKNKKPGLRWSMDPFSTHAAEVASSINSTTNDKFFSYTPELMLAWLMEPDVRHWITYNRAFQSKISNLDHIGIKTFVYYKLYPQMEIRSKYNGLEKLDFLQKLDANNELSKIWDEVKNQYPDGHPDTNYLDYYELYEKLRPE